MKIVDKPLSKKGEKTITKPMVIKALKKAVKKYGADTYYRDRPGANPNTCKYVLKDTTGKDIPGCLVGVILIEDFEAKPEQFMVPDDGYDGSTTRILNTIKAKSLLKRLDPNGYTAITQDATDILGEVQYKQDRGISWGAALTQVLNERGEK